MKRLLHIAWTTTRWFWRSHIGVALAVSAVTATLVGALVVGSSMRGSLRDLTLRRLERVDDILIGEHFFSRELARRLAENEMFQSHYVRAEPGIWFPSATVERSDGPARGRATGVSVLGVEPTFWNLANRPFQPPRDWIDDQVLINRALAEDLGLLPTDIAAGGAALTIRVPKPSLLPSDSALGKKRDLLENLVRLPVVGIVPDDALGQFALHASPERPRLVFLNLPYLQNELMQSSLAHWEGAEPINVVFLAGKHSEFPPGLPASNAAQSQLSPSLLDLGLTFKTVSMDYRDQGASRTAYTYHSLTTERLIFRSDLARLISERLPAAQPVFTYLANTLRLIEPRPGFAESIPYSMVSGLDFGSEFTLETDDGAPIIHLADDQLILNAWAARDLGAQPGDRVSISFYLPEAQRGELVEQTIELPVAAVARLVEPVAPYQYRRRVGLTPAQFDEPPTRANDPDLTPEVPGLTDAESIDRWDLPFETAERIRPADDEYWNHHRTTPKGFVSLATARSLWSSRFGDTTGFRIPIEVSREDVEQALVQLWRDRSDLFGLRWVRVKEQGLAASRGATPFDGLFLGLSSFVIVAALLLLGLLFRLSLEQRSEQLGLFLAVGFQARRLISLLTWEGGFVAVCGGLLGIALGIGYAATIVALLRTWWSGAVGQTFLEIHVSWRNVLFGFVASMTVCLGTMVWSIMRARRRPARELLTGRWESASGNTRFRRWISALAAVVLVAGAIALAIGASRWRGESQAGAFMGAGFLVLAAAMFALQFFLFSQSNRRPPAPSMTVWGVALSNTKRKPMRSMMSMGLMAVASFLIVALSAFRLKPTDSATGGIDWLAETVQPLFADLNTPAGQADILGREHLLAPAVRIYAWRYKPGDDASCTNPYQAQRPRILGATDEWIARYNGDSVTPFHWAGHLGRTEGERRNPWQLLQRRSPGEPIPCVIDKNTAVYSLKLYSLGQEFAIQLDSGQELAFRLVAMTENSILQGSILISESAFEQSFPEISGYRWFLIEAGAADAAAIGTLRDRLSDQGFSARRSLDLLRDLMAVQNTYLSAFQTLGALGLLLGTFGLAAVQWRSIIERRRELALLRAVGFSPARMLRMLLLEQAIVLGFGLSLGLLAALVAVLPQGLAGGASIPWGQLLTIFAIIVVLGWGVASWSARAVMRMELISSLRVG